MAVQPTIVSYPGDGSTTVFTFTFDYLKTDYVKVRVDGVDTAFSFNATKIVSIIPAPANGTTVVISRETDREALVDFVDGSILIEDDLDLANTQLLHIVQEAIDLSGTTLTLQSDGSLSAAGRRLGSLGTPVNDADAASKAWVEGFISGSVSASAASAAAAAASAVTAASHLDAFQDIYLGAAATDPVTDLDGDALAVGMIYFNTASEGLFVYNGTVWVSAPQGPAGVAGAVGATGPTGPAGPGLVAGGTAGQLAAKASGADYDVVWVDGPADGAAGGVGTYAFLAPAVGTNYSPGDVLAGSDLRWAVVASQNDWHFNTSNRVDIGTVGVGSWRAMGGSVLTGYTLASIFLRIA